MEKSLRMSVKEREALRDNIYIYFLDYVKIFNGSIHVKIQIIHFKYVSQLKENTYEWIFPELWGLRKLDTLKSEII